MNFSKVIYFSYTSKAVVVLKEYSFLCNFYPCEFVEDGFVYKSNEHYFQSKKYSDPEIRQKIIDAESPSKTKKISRMHPIDFVWWDSVREQVMKQGLILKFSQNPDLRQKLIDTYDKKLIEYSKNDRFWGGSAVNSENKLGNLLMEVREMFVNRLI